MFLLLQFILCLVPFQIITASSDRWTHISGGKKQRFEGDRNSLPGSRFSQIYCQESTSSSSLYMYGGFGFSGKDSTYGLLGQLWKFSTTTEKWSLIFDPVEDVYPPSIGGNYGVYNKSYHPSGRMVGSCFFRLGKFHIFGGDSTFHDRSKLPKWVQTETPNDDVWAFDFTINQWTIVSGDISGGYRTGNCSVSNKYCNPHSRYYHNQWDHFSDNKVLGRGLYVYGGVTRHPSGIVVILSDLLKFDAKTRTWEALIPFSGTYNILPNINSLNPKEFNEFHTPGSTGVSVTWIDQRQDDNSLLYILGGVIVLSPKQYVRTNQMFVFSIKKKMWKPVIEHNLENTTFYGSGFKEEFTAKNVFPSKMGMTAFSYPNEFPYVFIFGGTAGIIGQENSKTTFYNDLWVYEYDELNEYKFLDGYHSSTGEDDKMQDPRFPVQKPLPHRPPAMQQHSGWFVYNSKEINTFYIFGGNSKDGKWYGDTWKYEIYNCFGDFSFFENECSGRGVCEKSGTCTCDRDDYGGDTCSETLTSWLRFLRLMDGFGYTEKSVNSLGYFAYMTIPLIPLMLASCLFYLFKDCIWKYCCCCISRSVKLKKMLKMY